MHDDLSDINRLHRRFFMKGRRSKGHPERDCGCFGKRGRRFAGGKGGEQNAGSAGEARPEYRPRLE